MCLILVISLDILRWIGWKWERGSESPCLQFYISYKAKLGKATKSKAYMGLLKLLQGLTVCFWQSQVLNSRSFDLWRRKWQPTPVLLPRKFHGWRSLVGYSPWGHKELDTTERLHLKGPRGLNQMRCRRAWQTVKYCGCPRSCDYQGGAGGRP